MKMFSKRFRQAVQVFFNEWFHASSNQAEVGASNSRSKELGFDARVGSVLQYFYKKIFK